MQLSLHETHIFHSKLYNELGNVSMENCHFIPCQFEISDEICLFFRLTVTKVPFLHVS